MGYRHSLRKMERKFYDEIKDKEHKELVTLFGGCEENHFSIHDLGDRVTEICCLGKYTEFDVSDYVSPLFSKFDVSRDGECELMTKEGFKAIIDHYADKVIGMYGKLIEKSSIQAYREHMSDYMREWITIKPYNLNHGEEVSTSRKYEYSIFELVRLYKTFDRDNDILIFYGG